MSWFKKLFSKLMDEKKDAAEKEFTVGFIKQETWEKDMAKYIVINSGWTVKGVGAHKSKIIAADKTLITKQAIPTAELHKWIVDNYEPNGTLKTEKI